MVQYFFAWPLLSDIYPAGSPDPFVQTLGCVPYTEDQKAWPAYACLVLAETGNVAWKGHCPTVTISPFSVYRNCRVTFVEKEVCRGW